MHENNRERQVHDGPWMAMSFAKHSIRHIYIELRHAGLRVSQLFRWKTPISSTLQVLGVTYSLPRHLKVWLLRLEDDITLGTRHTSRPRVALTSVAQDLVVNSTISERKLDHDPQALEILSEKPENISW